MRKILLGLLSLSLFAGIAIAADDTISNSIISMKTSVKVMLNDTINSLKNYFKQAGDELADAKTVFEGQLTTAQALVAASQTRETNLTVLPQGKSSMPNCGNNKNLTWQGNKWVCVTPLYKTNCLKASDEYKYGVASTPAGTSYVCTKHSRGSSLSFYWEFRGYSLECTSSKTRKKIYSCYYNNKFGVAIEVDQGYCGGRSKPYAENITCYSEWKATAYGSCRYDKKRYRSEYCPANHVCVGEHIKVLSQECKTVWQTGSWSSCNSSAKKYRSVTCPTNYECTNSKPSSSATCYASWQTGDWGRCSVSCGGGTKRRGYWCPSNHICNGTTPSSTAACNTQSCTPTEPSTGWATLNWRSCSNGVQYRGVYCPFGTTCTGERPSGMRSC